MFRPADAKIDFSAVLVKNTQARKSPDRMIETKLIELSPDVRRVALKAVSEYLGEQ
jgi:hypothetical protein